MKGSNIVDLVNDTLRSKKGFEPYGWQYFVRGLAKSNAPESMIGNESRRDVVRQIKQSGVLKPRTLPTPELKGSESTPRRRKHTLPHPIKPMKRFQWQTL